MKTRVISGLIGVVILFLTLSQFHTWIFNVVLFMLYAIAAHEIYNVYKDKNFRRTEILLDIVGFLVLVVSDTFINISIWSNNKLIYVTSAINILSGFYMVVIAVLMVGFASIVVFKFNEIDFRNVASEIAFTLFALFGFYAALRFKTMLPYQSYGYDGVLLVICSAAIAWGGDTCAYFSGFLFGKHKMAPHLSPKKTIEGAIGGILGSVVLTWLVLWIYSFLKPVMENSNASYSVDFSTMVVIGVVAALGSFVGIIGDLFASAVKRQAGIKDYGNIMPGHGGVMDRFDSILLVIIVVSCAIPLIILNGGVFGV